MGTKPLAPLAAARPVTCEAVAEATRLEQPALADAPLKSTTSPQWRSITCDKWSSPWLGVTYDRTRKKGSLFVRMKSQQAVSALANVTVGATDSPAHAQAKLEGWKLLDAAPAKEPVIVWQRKSLALAGKELLLTDLESGASQRLTFERNLLDVACATLKPLSCVVLLEGPADLVFVDGDKKTTVRAPGLGTRAGLELSPDSELTAVALLGIDQLTVGIYRRSKKTWVQHTVPAQRVLDLGKWSEDPPGFIVTVEPDASLLLSLDDTSRRVVPRAGPSWVSPLGRRLEQRGSMTWLHAPETASTRL
jgi:hypothetical protein